eukprot:scaffold257_cov241-Pinguiococcus_pyrenoidosus.AAC.6
MEPQLFVANDGLYGRLEGRVLGFRGTRGPARILAQDLHLLDALVEELLQNQAGVQGEDGTGEPEQLVSEHVCVRAFRHVEADAQDESLAQQLDIVTARASARERQGATALLRAELALELLHNRRNEGRERNAPARLLELLLHDVEPPQVNRMAVRCESFPRALVHALDAHLRNPLEGEALDYHRVLPHQRRQAGGKVLEEERTGGLGVRRRHGYAAPRLRQVGLQHRRGWGRTGALDVPFRRTHLRRVGGTARSAADLNKLPVLPGEDPSIWALEPEQAGDLLGSLGRAVLDFPAGIVIWILVDIPSHRHRRARIFEGRKEVPVGGGALLVEELGELLRRLLVGLAVPEDHRGTGQAQGERSPVAVVQDDALQRTRGVRRRVSWRPDASLPAVGQLLGLGELIRLVLIHGDFQAPVLSGMRGDVEGRCVAGHAEAGAVHDGGVHRLALLPCHGVSRVEPGVDVDGAVRLAIQHLLDVAKEETGLGLVEAVDGDQVALRHLLVSKLLQQVRDVSVALLHFVGKLHDLETRLAQHQALLQEVAERDLRRRQGTVVNVGLGRGRDELRHSLQGLSFVAKALLLRRERLCVLRLEAAHHLGRHEGKGDSVEHPQLPGQGGSVVELVDLGHDVFDVLEDTARDQALRASLLDVTIEPPLGELIVRDHERLVGHFLLVGALVGGVVEVEAIVVPCACVEDGHRLRFGREAAEVAHEVRD